VDDYGHHPTEVRATLAAAKAALGRRVVCLFQPHRYTRTKHLLEEFATAFNQADKVVILDIYAAGEQPIAGVTGQAVCEGIRNHGHKDAVYIGDRQQAIERLAGSLRQGDLLLTLGAGDVWKLGEAVLERLKA
jgi:UDP-N-acetylmuramate--alanine ligase